MRLSLSVKAMRSWHGVVVAAGLAHDVMALRTMTVVGLNPTSSNQAWLFIFNL